uniref:Uncharacterized protein n=1 Tax=Octopus bimaculoides TaxID=37653 RepID=A0A0L8G7J6_OCTBM
MDTLLHSLNFTLLIVSVYDILGSHMPFILTYLFLSDPYAVEHGILSEPFSKSINAKNSNLLLAKNVSYSYLPRKQTPMAPYLGTETNCISSH